MSGPKIIIVRSPGELQRERDQTLRNLASRIAEWRAWLERNGELSSDTIANIEQRAKELETAFTVGHDFGMEKVTREIIFLKSEIERLQTEAIGKLANQKQRRRSLEMTARSLLQDSAHQIPESARAGMQRIIKQAGRASEAELFLFDQELSNTVNELLQVKEPAAEYTANTEFIKNLSTDIEAPQRYAAATPKESEKETRLSLLLAEIELMEGSSSSESFSERARSADLESDPSRKQLLLDSLLIDLSQHCRTRKNKMDALRILNTLQSELDLLENSACSPLKEKLALALESPELKEAELLEREVRNCVTIAAARKDAVEKRKAILAGFSALGYEVKEGMATGWAKDGRIVVSKRSSPDIGIEIGSTEAVERVQVRVVGIVNDGPTRDTSKDKEIETEWCSELAKIRTVLQNSGHATAIETAVAAGTTPLKTSKRKNWAADEDEEERQNPRKHQNLRTIDKS